MTLMYFLEWFVAHPWHGWGLVIVASLTLVACCNAIGRSHTPEE